MLMYFVYVCIYVRMYAYARSLVTLVIVCSCDNILMLNAHRSTNSLSFSLTHTHMHTRMHTLTHAYTHTYTHTYTHVHTRVHIHTHTHTCYIHVIIQCAVCIGILLQTLHTYRLPPTSTPKSEYFGDILTDAFTIAIVAYSISISLSKVFANKHGYSIHANQVLILYTVIMLEYNKNV